VKLSVIPEQHTTLVLNSLAMIWTAFLSVLYNRRDHGTTKEVVTTTAVPAEALKKVTNEEAKAWWEVGILGKQLSDHVGQLLQCSAGAISSSGALMAEFSARAKQAKAAAGAAWSASAQEVPSSASSASPPLSPGGASFGDRQLRDQLEASRRQIEDQFWELDALRRTVSAQAVRIRILEEAAGSEVFPPMDTRLSPVIGGGAAPHVSPAPARAAATASAVGFGRSPSRSYANSGNSGTSADRGVQLKHVVLCQEEAGCS